MAGLRELIWAPLDANRGYDRIVKAGPSQGAHRDLLRAEWWLQQLIEWQLGQPPLSDWCPRDPWHSQVAHDALYAVRRAWERDEPPPSDDVGLVAALACSPGTVRAGLLDPGERRLLLAAVGAVVAALADPSQGPEVQSPDGVWAQALPPLWGEAGWAIDVHGMSRDV